MIITPECECRSMKPGAMTRPAASMRCAARCRLRLPAKDDESVAAGADGATKAGRTGAVDDAAVLDEQVEVAPSGWGRLVHGQAPPADPRTAHHAGRSRKMSG